MLEKILNNKLRTLLVLLLVALLATVRAYEETLFYDPFLSYFKGDYLRLEFPKYNDFHLFLGLGFRYLLNTILSLGIIQLLFADFKLTKFTSILYLVFFIFLIIALFTVLHFSGKENNFLLFYVRRFLIQPLFLFLFIPAFFYQKTK